MINLKNIEDDLNLDQEVEIVRKEAVEVVRGVEEIERVAGADLIVEEEKINIVVEETRITLVQGPGRDPKIERSINIKRGTELIQNQGLMIKIKRIREVKKIINHKPDPLLWM
jgi:DNA polymerase III sliding clamp (beta) subunit (PCNA family)